ncbi:Asp23/Gls24 family envelope stress response protein [Chlamydiota bacterium]
MSSKELPWNNDFVSIHDDVFYDSLKKAMMKTPGVYGLYTKNIIGLRELFSKKKRVKQAIIIDDRHNMIHVVVKITIRLGLTIKAISLELQQTIKNQITVLTGCDVSSITVIVEGVVS